ncbi:MAG: hypothetical protein K8J08_20710 [Thermoanaerobaculia bacterium]|nr:hypothetical protein [Thermoanaerobaculia bacterium]
MVQIVENWSDLTGVVQAVRAEATGDRVTVTVGVDSAAPVEEFAHLLADAVGTEIDVSMPASLVAEQEVTVGGAIRFRVRRASAGRNYVHKKFLEGL